MQGELSEGRVGYGGHFYGELVQRAELRDGVAAGGRGVPRDGLLAKARITCWASTYRTLSRTFETMTGTTLHAGLTVMLEVGVTFHQQYGYSLTVTDIDPSYTLGDMARRRQEILRQLEADGILHDNQTLPLPLLARRIAVVSSATAAGYGDFCNQLTGNDYAFHFSIRLFPAIMQGSRVEESVIAALETIAQEADQWDVVVIIRGGGASSDLSDFDSYPLAACIAQFPLPVITGIGHDRDETVLDHVAHTHLKTPTAVAAFLIDHLAETAQHVEELGQRIAHAVKARLSREEQRVLRLATVLPLAFRTMRERQDHRLVTLMQRMLSAQREARQRERHRLDLLEQRLRGLDPDLLLKRGYSITLVDGQLLRDACQAQEGQTLVTRLANGTIHSVVKHRNTKI